MSFDFAQKIGARVVTFHIHFLDHHHLEKELEQLKVYENFEEVKKLKETVKNHEQKIIYLQSPDYIENSIRVKKLSKKKKLKV